VTKLDLGICQRCPLKAAPIVLTLSFEKTDGLLCLQVADMLDVSSGSAYVTVVSISLCLWFFLVVKGPAANATDAPQPCFCCPFPSNGAAVE
jgi:hypothetical protein